MWKCIFIFQISVQYFLNFTSVTFRVCTVAVASRWQNIFRFWHTYKQDSLHDRQLYLLIVYLLTVSASLTSSQKGLLHGWNGAYNFNCQIWNKATWNSEQAFSSNIQLNYSQTTVNWKWPFHLNITIKVSHWQGGITFFNRPSWQDYLLYKTEQKTAHIGLVICVSVYPILCAEMHVQYHFNSRMADMNRC